MATQSILNVIQQAKKSKDAQPKVDSIKVKIIKTGHLAKFTKTTQDDGSILNFSIADSTGAIMASINDETKFKFIQDGKSVILKNYVIKGDKVALGPKTKIMITSEVEVPKQIAQTAIEMVTPLSPSKTISEAISSPARTTLSVEGQVSKVCFSQQVNNILCFLAHLHSECELLSSHFVCRPSLRLLTLCCALVTSKTTTLRVLKHKT